MEWRRFPRNVSDDFKLAIDELEIGCRRHGVAPRIRPRRTRRGQGAPGRARDRECQSAARARLLRASARAPSGEILRPSPTCRAMPIIFCTDRRYAGRSSCVPTAQSLLAASTAHAWADEASTIGASSRRPSQASRRSARTAFPRRSTICESVPLAENGKSMIPDRDNTEPDGALASRGVARRGLTRIVYVPAD